MSLLNEALKQASRAHQQKQGGGGLDGVPMRYAASERQSKMMFVLPLVSLLALMLAAWFAWKWSQARTEANVAVDAPAAMAARPPEAVIADSKPVASLPASPPAAPAVERPVETGTDVSAAWDVPQIAQPTLAQSAAEPAAPPPQFPELRLQGIFYRPSDPTALINGRTLGIGDVVMEVRVEKIEPQAVTVEWKGETRVLRLFR